MSRFSPCALAILSALAFAPLAQAITLDWDTVTWAAGSLTNSYDIDPTRAGNDITVIVTGNTSQFQNSNATPNVLTPAITNRDQGGLSPAELALTMAVDFTTRTEAVTVTVNFSALYTLGVQNVSFTIFDVDFQNSGGSQYQDQLRNITAIAMDGSLVAPIVTVNSSNSLSGTGINQVVTGNVTTSDTGPTSGNANVTISFGTTAIRSFTFTYGNSATAPNANPTYQHISLHDINFTPVPELNPALASAFSCLAAFGFILLRQRRGVRE